MIYKKTWKYILIKEYDSVYYRPKALKDFSDVSKGNIGGYIDGGYYNLSQEGNCWVYNNAIISNYAQVYDNARISEDAVVRGNARVYGNATVYGYAIIDGVAQIFENAQVSGDAIIAGNTKVSENTCISDYYDL
jgi:carbonic anhydrase/acetyltransferase-like protein (isoleucine patch superfamily)